MQIHTKIAKSLNLNSNFHRSLIEKLKNAKL